MGALGRFLQSPLTAFMSLAVVAVAVALPALLYVLLENTERLLGTWEDAGTLSVYLKPTVSDEAAAAVGRQAWWGAARDWRSSGASAGSPRPSTPWARTRCPP